MGREGRSKDGQAVAVNHCGWVRRDPVVPPWEGRLPGAVVCQIAYGEPITERRALFQTQESPSLSRGVSCRSCELYQAFVIPATVSRVTPAWLYCHLFLICGWQVVRIGCLSLMRLAIAVTVHACRMTATHILPVFGPCLVDVIEV